MKILEIITPVRYSVAEDAGAGASASGGIATSMGGSDGFGLSPFMKSTSPKRKTKKRTKQ